MNQQNDQEQKIRSDAIREGIRLERSRVIAMLFSDQWKYEPCQDAAGLIMNGMHWEELRRRVDDACD